MSKKKSTARAKVPARAPQKSAPKPTAKKPATKPKPKAKPAPAKKAAPAKKPVPKPAPKAAKRPVKKAAVKKAVKAPAKKLPAKKVVAKKPAPPAKKAPAPAKKAPAKPAPKAAPAPAAKKPVPAPKAAPKPPLVPRIAPKLTAGKPPPNGTVLIGDSSFPFTLHSAVSGADLFVEGAVCTFSAPSSAITGSGLCTKNEPAALGVSLPMDLAGHEPTSGSAIPMLPWGTSVRIRNHATGTEIEAPLIDIGPAKNNPLRAAIDVTKTTFIALGGQLDKGRILADFTIIGAARYVPANATKAAPEPLPPEIRAHIDALPTGPVEPGIKLPANIADECTRNGLRRALEAAMLTDTVYRKLKIGDIRRFLGNAMPSVNSEPQRLSTLSNAISRRFRQAGWHVTVPQSSWYLEETRQTDTAQSIAQYILSQPYSHDDV